MNLVGKIFTFVIFLMCLVFMTFAIMVQQTHINWKEKVVGTGGLQTQLADARKLNADLKEQKKTVEAEKAVESTRLTSRITQLENEKTELAKERDANETKKAELEGQIRDMVEAMAAVHKSLDAMRKETDAMRVQIKEAQVDRDANFKRMVDLKDKADNLDAEVHRLDRVHSGLADELSKAKEALRYYGVNEKSDYKMKEPPQGLEGEVTAVPRADTIEISIGSDDGLRKGHKLEVVRLSNKSYVGRIEVLDVSPNRAVCRPIADMQRSPIQKGDHVYASLSQIK